MPVHRVTARTAAVYLVVLTGACGGVPSDFEQDFQQQTQAVFNGHAYAGDPAVGKLVFNRGTSKERVCTGTLIGNTTVITAAHCVTDRSTAIFEVGGSSVEVESWTAHPNYDASKVNVFDENGYDLGIVRLRSEPSVTPIPINRERPKRGQLVTIVGFGYTSAAQQSEGLAADKYTRNSVTKTIDQIGARSVQVGGGGNDGTCKGDSGAPYISTVEDPLSADAAPRRLIAVHFSGSGCGADNWVGMGAAVDAFIDWITTTSGGDVTEPQSSVEQESASSKASLFGGVGENNGNTNDAPQGSVDKGSNPNPTDDQIVGAGCSVSGAAGRGPLLLWVLLALVIVRRRRR